MARDAMQNMVHDTTPGQLRNKVINFIQKKKKTTRRAESLTALTHQKQEGRNQLYRCLKTAASSRVRRKPRGLVGLQVSFTKGVRPNNGVAYPRLTIG
jgi:hypothetical protein